MEDLRNSDWQAIQLLLMQLVTVKEDRTAFIMLTSASQRGNTQRQGPVPCHLHTSPPDPRWAEHTQAPELLRSGINPLELIPPQPLGAAAPTPSSALLTNSIPKSSFPPSTGWGLCSLDSYLPLEWGPSLQHEARSTSPIRAPREAQKTGPLGIHAHLWRGKTGFLYYTGIILHLFTDKKKSKSLLIAISSYSNVFQKKVTTALGMYMPEGQMERQGKD